MLLSPKTMLPIMPSTNCMSTLIRMKLNGSMPSRLPLKGPVTILQQHSAKFNVSAPGKLIYGMKPWTSDLKHFATRTPYRKSLAQMCPKSSDPHGPFDNERGDPVVRFTTLRHSLWFAGISRFSMHQKVLINRLLTGAWLPYSLFSLAVAQQLKCTTINFNAAFV